MDRYHRRISPKTKFLNFFRTLFTIPLLEKILVRLILKNPNRFTRKLFPPNYLYNEGSFRNVQRQSINYKLDISHVVDHYLYWGVYDSGYSSIVEEIKNAKVILDIGANIATKALYFASINSHAQILAFEPHPASFIRANENIRLNLFRNIRLFNIGLGERKETLKLYEVNKNDPGRNRVIAEEKNLPFKNIEVETLDRIIGEGKINKVDFIKLDVEGFEYSVLAGGKNTITQSKPIMFIELDDNNLRENNRSAKELIELLVSFGYTEIFEAENLKPVTIRQEFNNCHYDIIVR